MLVILDPQLYAVAPLAAGENVRLLATMRSVMGVTASDRHKSNRCRIVTRVMLDQEPPRDLGHLRALLWISSVILICPNSKVLFCHTRVSLSLILTFSFQGEREAEFT